MDHLTERTALTSRREPQQRSDPRVCCASSSSAMPGHRRSTVSSSRCATRSARSSDWATLSVTITPDGLYDDSCPTHPEIRLSLFPGRRVARLIDAFAPGGRAYRHGRSAGTRRAAVLPAQTLSLHHGIPHAVSRVRLRRSRLPVDFTYRWMRWFHAPAKALMVATPDIRRRLAERGFANLAMWFARRGRRASSIPVSALSSRRTGRFFSTSGAWPSKRTSKHFSRSTCPGPSGWWAMVRLAASSSAVSPTPVSSAPRPVRIWPGTFGRRMSSSFRAVPIRSDS